MRTSYDRNRGIVNKEKSNDDKDELSIEWVSSGFEDEYPEDFEKISAEVDRALIDVEINEIFTEDDTNSLDINYKSSYDFLKTNEEVDSSLEGEDNKIDEELISSNKVEEDAINEDDEESIKDEVQNPEENSRVGKHGKKNKRGKIIAGVISSIVVVILAVFVGSRLLGEENIDTVGDLQDKIEELYTNDKKEDIRSNVSSSKVDKYLEKLDTLEDLEDSDKESIRSELKSISYFIADKDILDEINSSDYDFNNPDMAVKLSKVDDSIKEYTVPGLVMTNNNILVNIKADYEEYVNLKNELSTVKDYLSFDDEGYQLKVNKVNHKVNKEELQDLLDELVKAKENAQQIEDLKKAATEEALKKAQELQEETEKSLNDAKDKLDSYKEEAENFFSGLFSGSSKEESSN